MRRGGKINPSCSRASEHSHHPHATANTNEQKRPHNNSTCHHARAEVQHSYISQSLKTRRRCEFVSDLLYLFQSPSPNLHPSVSICSPHANITNKSFEKSLRFKFFVAPTDFLERARSLVALTQRIAQGASQHLVTMNFRSVVDPTESEQPVNRVEQRRSRLAMRSRRLSFLAGHKSQTSCHVGMQHRFACRTRVTSDVPRRRVGNFTIPRTSECVLDIKPRPILRPYAHHRAVPGQLHQKRFKLRQKFAKARRRMVPHERKRDGAIAAKGRFGHVRSRDYQHATT